jgi:hypothetical protein
MALVALFAFWSYMAGFLARADEMPWLAQDPTLRRSGKQKALAKPGLFEHFRGDGRI